MTASFLAAHGQGPKNIACTELPSHTQNTLQVRKSCLHLRHLFQLVDLDSLRFKSGPFLALFMPRPQMWFTRAAVLSHLGLHKQAAEELDSFGLLLA